MNALPAPAPAARRRLQVREAVMSLMSEQGLRFSMEAVAARVGCAKQTLYSQFGSKQGLLRTAMLEQVALSTLPLEVDGADLRTCLLAFANEHLRRLTDPTLMAAIKLANAEAHRFPDEARTLFEDGCDNLLNWLAERLHQAMHNNQLRRDDPHMAAELLLSMINGVDMERQRFDMPYRDEDAARQRWAEFAVSAFLRAFAPHHDFRGSHDAAPAPVSAL